MASNPDGITAIRDSLIAELKAETARRVALVQAGNPPPTTYSVGGKSVEWNAYLTEMRESIKEWNELVIACGGDGGLYEITETGYSA